MFNTILRFFRLAPTTVEGALGGVMKSLEHLRHVADAKKAEAAAHGATITAAVAAKAEAEGVAAHADRVHTAIAALIA